MSMHRIFSAVIMAVLSAVCLTAQGQPQQAQPIMTAPTFVPDYTHQNDPLPAGILAWDETTKSVDTTNGQDFARFVFAFTNIATAVTVGEATNVSYATNFTIVTNRSFLAVVSGHKYNAVPAVSSSTNVYQVTNSATPIAIAILAVKPSCGCTTAELPPTPWVLPPGTNSVIRVAVNLAGKSGTVFKSVNVATDHGRMDLMLKINIAPPPPPRMLSEAERAAGVEAAKVDRQAVFKGDCASCHAKNVAGEFGEQLFKDVCAVCHEAEHRATMVPDLRHLKDSATTSEEFWRAWITSGKAGTLMPAFATSQGGPLTDLQVANLAAYLNQIIPPHPALPADQK